MKPSLRGLGGLLGFKKLLDRHLTVRLALNIQGQLERNPALSLSYQREVSRRAANAPRKFPTLQRGIGKPSFKRVRIHANCLPSANRIVNLNFFPWKTSLLEYCSIIC